MVSRRGEGEEGEGKERHLCESERREGSKGGKGGGGGAHSRISPLLFDNDHLQRL